MAAQDASATGADYQAEVRKRNTGQPNGSYIPKEVGDKLDEKTKQKVSGSSGIHEIQSMADMYRDV